MDEPQAASDDVVVSAASVNEEVLLFRRLFPAGRLIGVLMVAGSLAALAQAHTAAHNDEAMAGHMDMTSLKPLQPGDKERAAAIVAAARKAADPYKDYHKALEDGYAIFLPEVKQNVYHFTNYAHAYRNNMNFDPSRPMPDSLTPPNGATAVEIIPALIPTIPYSNASLTRQMRSIS